MKNGVRAQLFGFVLLVVAAGGVLFQSAFFAVGPAAVALAAWQKKRLFVLGKIKGGAGKKAGGKRKNWITPNRQKRGGKKDVFLPSQI